MSRVGWKGADRDGFAAVRRPALTRLHVSYALTVAGIGVGVAILVIVVVLASNMSGLPSLCFRVLKLYASELGSVASIEVT